MIQNPSSPIVDDAIAIIEDAGAAEQPVQRPWRILIADDDEQVHASTRFALREAMAIGRGFECLHAYSASQAKEMLIREPDIAVILLDVVMESDDAGLLLARWIREDRGMQAIRIVLRTGQPGYAPESSVIETYDINDYRTKAELTHIRLMTSLTSALRSYLQIVTIEASRHGLEKIVAASSTLFVSQSLTVFAEGVLTQICALLGAERDGIVLATARTAGYGTGPDREAHILAAAGRFSTYAGEPLDALPNPAVRRQVARALAERRSIFADRDTVLFIPAPSGDDVAVHFVASHPLDAVDQQLLEVFSLNIALGFDSVRLYEHTRALAYRDPLTGLSSRAKILEELERRLARNLPTALAVIDIDGFQIVNDGLGPDAGDALLREFACRLAGGVPRERLARLTADVFGVLFDRTDGLDRQLEELRLKVGHPIDLEDGELPLSFSIGHYTAKPGRDKAEQALRSANIALKTAKRVRPGSTAAFDESMEQSLQSTLRISRSLRGAVERNELVLYFQPQVSLANRGTIGVEALVRWRRPDGSMVSPGMFIPAAEHSGQIVGIGFWVLRKSCEALQLLRANGSNVRYVAVNVSPRQFREPDFVRTVIQTVDQAGLEPSCIELEITESLFLDDRSGVETMLRDLRTSGFRIAVDDFGTGYSSLSYLQRLPVDRVKIDRSFVMNLESDQNARTIAACVTHLGHELGLDVVAEGIETAVQEQVMHSLGCDFGQGYLYAAPMPFERLAAFSMG